MAKVHDKYVVELAEVIKGYGNDPDINDPFCLSEFYRFYEVPNVCVSAENFKKMRPLNDYTEEIEPESISEWKKEFREYVDSLDIARDDWKGIVEYINDVPTVQPDLDEWCTDCKEYDSDKHCCPRFSRVIREALKEAQPKVIVLCADCIKRDKCKFYDTQGDGGYCRYGRDKDGRFNPQTGGD